MKPEQKELFEKLADIEHQRWADWQKYTHSKCRKDKDGNLIVPVFLVEQWERQIKTPYKDLTEIEKESDRDQVKRYWDLIKPEQRVKVVKRIIIPGLPPTDNHIYGQRGNFRFMWKEAKDWKQLANECATKVWTGDILEKKVEAKVWVYLKRERDIQGSLKVLFDSFEGVVYNNDKQVWHFEVFKILDEESKLNPRIEVEIRKTDTILQKIRKKIKGIK